MNALVYMRRWPRLLSAPYCGRDDAAIARLAKACAVDMPEHISDMFVERIAKRVVVLLLIVASEFSAIARVCVDCRGVTRDCRDAWHLFEPGRPDAVVEREDLLRIAPQLVLPNRSSFSLEDVLESVVESTTNRYDPRRRRGDLRLLP